MLVYCLYTILRYFPRHFKDKHFSQFLSSISTFSRVGDRSYTHITSATLVTIRGDGAHQLEEGWTVRKVQADLSKNASWTK